MENTKPENVKIINIIMRDTTVLLGLGDDSMVYYWNAETHVWMIYSHR